MQNKGIKKIKYVATILIITLLGLNLFEIKTEAEAIKTQNNLISKGKLEYEDLTGKKVILDSNDLRLLANKIDETSENINNQLTIGENQFYFDYQNGIYGYNTSPLRNEDTFHPFSTGNINKKKIVDALAYSGLGITNNSTEDQICTALLTKFPYIPAPLDFFNTYSNINDYVNRDTLQDIGGGRIAMSACGNGARLFTDKTIRYKDPVTLVGFKTCTITGNMSACGDSAPMSNYYVTATNVLTGASTTIASYALSSQGSVSINTTTNISGLNGNYYISIRFYSGANGGSGSTAVTFNMVFRP